MSRAETLLRLKGSADFDVDHVLDTTNLETNLSKAVSKLAGIKVDMRVEKDGKGYITTTSQSLSHSPKMFKTLKINSLTSGPINSNLYYMKIYYSYEYSDNTGKVSYLATIAFDGNGEITSKGNI